MPKQTSALLSFNRGIMSRLGLARMDISRYAMSAFEQQNWMPRVLGSMKLRPGFQYLSATKSNGKARQFPFIFSTTDTALIEMTDSVMRVRVSDVLITRPAVTAAVTNGTFNTDVTGWTDNDEAGATSAFQAGGYLSLIGTGTNAAIRDQQVAVSEVGTEHALRVVIQRGPVTLKVGQSTGTDEYVTETSLGVGTHSLSFTPTGDFWIRFSNVRIAASWVNSVAVEAAGIMELPTPYALADLPLVRAEVPQCQSGDILYVACSGHQQRKIERRTTRSWSIVLYAPETGPFLIENVSTTTITPSALTGDITLTASKPTFKSTHVGALYRMESVGQQVTQTCSGEDQWTAPIRVSGIGAQRAFQYAVADVWVGTVTLQYSVAAPGAWVDVLNTTVNVSTSYNDGLDNQIIYYRIGIKAGDYTSGTAGVALSFASGSGTGIVRITAYSSSLSVSAAVLSALFGTTGTANWWEGQWSDYRGWPSALSFFEGRLWWFGKAKLSGSVSDDFENFDDTVLGDSGPILRSIGDGPVDSINWAIPAKRLLVGTGSSELSVRSSSLDEPLTPTNFNIKPTTTQGSAAIASLRIDSSAVFVQRSLSRLLELVYDPGLFDYALNDLTLIAPDLNSAGITQIAVQRQPDTRIHCVRADGTVAVLIFDRVENVTAWITVVTDGLIEDVAVLPGDGEDAVYYTVKRSLGRYLEKWAMESECVGGTLNKQADAFIVYQGVATTTITGLSHLEGKTVVVWGDGRDLGTYTVSGGQITGITTAVSNAIVGLYYEARFESMKQCFAAAMGTPLNQRKRIDHVGLILLDTHYQGLQFGPDFDNLDDLPLMSQEQVTPADTVWEEFDEDSIVFPGTWSTDSRICLKAFAPRPCTVLAATISMTTSDKA
jgi:hypothetical protein